MLTSIVERSLPNIDGRNSELESSSSQKPCTISMNLMQLLNLWYPRWMVNYKNLNETQKYATHKIIIENVMKHKLVEHKTIKNVKPFNLRGEKPRRF